MKSSFKKLTGSIIELEVVLDKNEFKNYWDAAYEEALARVHLKGFRPGTAPRDLADQAVDREKVFYEAANAAVRYSLDEISKTNQWTILDKPRIELQETDELGGLKYKAVFPIFPDIRLGNYKKIAKKIFSQKKDVVVSDDDLNKALDWLRQSRAKDGRLPELNDEFAKSLGNFATLDDLKKSILSGLKLEREFKERDKQRIKVLEDIIKDTKMDIPQIMIEKALERFTGNKPELREKFQDKAKNYVASNLVLYKIAEIEKIDYNPEQGLDSEKVFQFLEKLAVN